MAIRGIIYAQLLAIALTGLAAYWDRVGVPLGYGQFVYGVGIYSIVLIPIAPLATLLVLCFSRLELRHKLYAAFVSAVACVAQIIAGLPLVA
ncbi:hypothetical protein [Anatilimnocola floriformis]|uniref:hypothetical protein n=1 Tax=Anatilimnocola floriformis TaxID=2948575 RepID=UPI0020C3EE5B|nr:hypothetical protein [Anatilimnocola floriformis]